MSDELRELYQEVILDHGRHPRNFRHPEHCDHEAKGENPLCGDKVNVFLTLDDTGRISDAAFEGRGCAISTASASLMTEVVRGKTRDEAVSLFKSFQTMCMEDNFDMSSAEDTDAMDRLQVLGGVRAYPMRVKCATLAWHTLQAALDSAALSHEPAKVTTE